MGFNHVNHRVGASIFVVLFILGIFGVIYYSTADALQYHMAFIGSLIWVFGKFSFEKNKDDKKGNVFDYPKYLDAEWDNLVINLAGIYVVVPQMHNIVGLQDKVEYSDLWYYAAGILTDGLYILIILAAKAKKKYESRSPLPEQEPTN